jgi:hypothetical protein
MSGCPARPSHWRSSIERPYAIGHRTALVTAMETGDVTGCRVPLSLHCSPVHDRNGQLEATVRPYARPCGKFRRP